MINYLKLIQSLHPIDVIIAKKKSGLGRLLNHYIVYLGNGVFVGNLRGSVKQISHYELLDLLNKYEPVKIRRFYGNYHQIQQARTRAHQRIGNKYSFLGFNCEHFANWVQYGKESSSQVTNGFLITLSFVTLTLINNNNR